MFRQIDYPKIFRLFETTASFPPQLDSLDVLLPRDLVIQSNRKSISSSVFLDWLYRQKGWEDFFPNPGSHLVDIEVFLLANIKGSLYQNLEQCKTLGSVRAALKESQIVARFDKLEIQFEFLTFSFLVYSESAFWRGLTKEFDAGDWKDIFLLADLLPLSDVSLEELFDWIIRIMERNPNDVGIEDVLKKVVVWGDFCKYGAADIEKFLPVLFTSESARKALPAFIRMIDKKQSKGVKHYLSLFEFDVLGHFWYEKMFAIGNVLKGEEEREYYFQHLVSLNDVGKLNAKDFILICGSFGFIDSRVTDFIDQSLTRKVKGDNQYLGIGYFLTKQKSNIDWDWFFSTLKALISVDELQIEPYQSSLLRSLMEENLDASYELVEHRIQLDGGSKVLEDSILCLAQLDTIFFQKKFLSWLNSDDSNFHRGVFRFSSGKLPDTIYDIPKELFVGFSDLDLAYIASKTVGFVYSKVPLQKLLLSIIRSVNNGSSGLSGYLGRLLKHYLIYNYRSTLEIIKGDLESRTLSPFTKLLFEDALVVFERYFEGLDTILPIKELKPASKLVQWVKFYEGRSLAEYSKTIKKGGVFSIGKTLAINSHRWAIKRQNESVHKVQPLGNIRIEREFPSGENLNPVHQESIRVQMKLLKRYEINIS
ncbi:hypothetical protein [Algoriphagus sp.]|uniref:hypothetical protein n=1 Tax=Algoriphagus sp. TaxID=1872435 RepID=UPI003F726E27